MCLLTNQMGKCTYPSYAYALPICVVFNKLQGHQPSSSKHKKSFFNVHTMPIKMERVVSFFGQLLKVQRNFPRELGYSYTLIFFLKKYLPIISILRGRTKAQNIRKLSQDNTFSFRDRFLRHASVLRIHTLLPD